ncbi:MAG TPA: hypothetical protein VIC87_06910 [Vicinamibacteria bacterium]
MSDETGQSATYPGWQGLQGAMQGFPASDHAEKLFGTSRRNRGYWALPATQGVNASGAGIQEEPARLVGFAPVDQIPGVRWVVVVEQDRSEALGPILGVTRYLWIHFIGAFGTVILLALYFSFKTEAPVIEERLHLHEEHVPASMRSGSAQ